jgi:hypothetical protein
MILGIVGIVLCFAVIPSLLGLIFGLRSAKQVKQSDGLLTGAGMARAGWILGIAGLVIGAGFYVLLATGALDTDEKSIGSLEVGDCVNVADIAENAEIASVPSVPCDELHDGEVFHIDQLNPDRDVDYPGQEQIDLEIGLSCIDEFETYVGTSLDLGRERPAADVGDEELTLFYIYPLEDTWDLGRGEYTCIATTLSGDATLTGSVRGAGG